MLQLFDHLRTEVNEGWNLIQHKKRKNIKKFSEKKISAFLFVYSKRNTEKDNYKDLVSWMELKKSWTLALEAGEFVDCVMLIWGYSWPLYFTKFSFRRFKVGKPSYCGQVRGELLSLFYCIYYTVVLFYILNYSRVKYCRGLRL